MVNCVKCPKTNISRKLDDCGKGGILAVVVRSGAVGKRQSVLRTSAQASNGPTSIWRCGAVSGS